MHSILLVYYIVYYIVYYTYITTSILHSPSFQERGGAPTEGGGRLPAPAGAGVYSRLICVYEGYIYIYIERERAMDR